VTMLTSPFYSDRLREQADRLRRAFPIIQDDSEIERTITMLREAADGYQKVAGRLLEAEACLQRFRLADKDLKIARDLLERYTDTINEEKA
jgi:hypothetical protein